MSTLMATEKGEISELKQRPWLGVENGGNSPRGGSPKIEKRALIGCSAG